ncbi:MAG: type II toxin-antitoxin system VapC family toxin [Promethearchaeota archaeon]
MAVIDTDFLVSYLRGKENADEIFKKLLNEHKALKTTIFNAAELYKGCYKMKNVVKGLIDVKNLLSSLKEILIFDEMAVQEYAKISIDLEKKGEPIGVFDELIASICLANNEILYSGNTQHFEKVPGLLICNWRDLT